MHDNNVYIYLGNWFYIVSSLSFIGKGDAHEKDKYFQAEKM